MGYFQLTIYNITNPSGKEQGGSCCDGKSSDTCGSTCDTYVEVCLSAFEKKGDGCYYTHKLPTFRSRIYEDKNSISMPEGDVDSQIDYQNPMKIPFAIWKVGRI